MTETLNIEQVEEILAGCEGVTPGPWKIGISGDYPPASLLDGDHTPIHSDTWGAFISIVTNIDRGGDRVGTSLQGKANAAHIARLDPQTVASLAAELLVLRKRVEWQDISTAPKDGSVILVWDEDVGHCDVCRWSGHHQCWHQLQWGVGDPPVDEDMVGWTVYYPVRWMPLPTPKEPS